MQPFVAAAHAESSTCVHRPDNDSKCLASSLLHTYVELNDLRPLEDMEKTIDYIPCICVPSLDVSSAGKTLHRSIYLPYYASVGE